MGSIILSADELGIDVLETINKRKEDDLYIIGLPDNFKLLRGINKNIYTLTEDSPLRNMDLDSLEDCIILSDKPSGYYKEIFDEDIPISFYYKQRGLRTSSTMDTSKAIKLKHTDKCTLRVIGSDVDFKSGYENYFEKLKTEVFITTNSSIPQLKINKTELLTEELKKKLKNGFIDLGDKLIFEQIVKRYYTGTKIDLGELAIPISTLPPNTQFNQVNYNAILFNFRFSDNFEAHLKEISFEIKHWLNRTSVNNIYVLTNEDKLALSNLAIPKIYIKTLEER